MKVRASTVDGPQFMHEGLLVTGPGWMEIETDSLTDAGRAALVEYRGRIIRIHPDDEAAFDAQFGARGASPTPVTSSQAAVTPRGEQPARQPQPVTPVPDHPIAGQQPITPEAGGPPREGERKTLKKS